MHPLSPSLKDLTDEELLKKINELYAKMRMVMNNPPVYRQMASIMDDYQVEQRIRLMKRIEEFEKTELSKKIDIGH